jgi:hypothetical protein
MRTPATVQDYVHGTRLCDPVVFCSDTDVCRVQNRDWVCGAMHCRVEQYTCEYR